MNRSAALISYQEWAKSANDHIFLAQNTIPPEQIEIQWVAKCETLLIHGGIAQWAGIWAFALGGRRHQGRCWHITLDGDWKLCEPGEMPVFPWLTDYPEASPWIDSLLPEIRELWHKGLSSSLILNHLIQSCPLTKQLFGKYPALIADWCLHLGEKQPWWKLSQEVCHDPKTLLLNLGYYPDKQSLKLYQRLDFSHSSERRRLLKRIIGRGKEPDRELLHKLRHFPRLSIRGLKLLLDFPDYFMAPLACQLADISDEDYHRHHRIITDTYRLFRANQEPRDRLRNIRNFEQLERLHDRLIEANTRLGQRDFMAMLKKVHGDCPAHFSPQPVPDAEGITAITTPEALYQESKLMQHCVSSYIGAVLQNESYIYHVEYGEEQATLELKKLASFENHYKWLKWTACQLRGKYNKEVSEALQNKVVQWLEQHEIPVRRGPFTGFNI